MHVWVFPVSAFQDECSGLKMKDNGWLRPEARVYLISVARSCDWYTIQRSRAIMKG